ncbi:hypothetical protein V6N13_106182 [Hibiscus sabdariffa]
MIVSASGESKELFLVAGIVEKITSHVQLQGSQKLNTNTICKLQGPGAREGAKWRSLIPFLAKLVVVDALVHVLKLLCSALKVDFRFLHCKESWQKTNGSEIKLPT